MRPHKLLPLMLLALPAVSLGQSRSSFLDVTDINGLTLASSNGFMTYTVGTGADPTLVFNSTTYHITDVIGFWALSDLNDMTASANGPNPWDFNLNNSGPGGIAGFMAATANSGIGVNDQVTCTYDTLSYDLTDRYGFKVRFSTNFEDTGGNTAFVTGFTPVPEPASFLILGAGIAGIVRYRRRAKR